MKAGLKKLHTDESKFVPMLKYNTTPRKRISCLIKHHAMKTYWGN